MLHLTAQELEDKLARHKIWISSVLDTEPKGEYLGLGDVSLTGRELKDKRLSYSYISSCDLGKSSFIQCAMDSISLINCKMDYFNTTNSSYERSRFFHVEALSSTMRECKLDKSTIDSSNFSFCSFYKVSFVESKLERSKFLDCTFVEADFRGASLDSVDLKGTQFTGGDLSIVSAKGCCIKKVKFPTPRDRIRFLMLGAWE